MVKAVVCRELGPPEVLRIETIEPVALAPGQVRVAIHAAGLNFPDILMAAGQYQLKPPLPFIPGMEASGEVIEVADAPGVSIGDKVIVKARFGCYAGRDCRLSGSTRAVACDVRSRAGRDLSRCTWHGVSRVGRSRADQAR